MEGIVHLTDTDLNNKTIKIGTWEWKATARPKKPESVIKDLGCE